MFIGNAGFMSDIADESFLMIGSCMETSQGSLYIDKIIGNLLIADMGGFFEFPIIQVRILNNLNAVSG